MKNYWKNVFCLLMVALLFLISACKKTNTNLSNQTPERRDTLIGKYYCADHYNSWGSLYNMDTIEGYDTLIVSKSLANQTDILVNGGVLSPQSRNSYLGTIDIGGHLTNQAIFDDAGTTISYHYSEIDGSGGGSRRFYYGSKNH